jgi:hypothetical protein
MSEKVRGRGEGRERGKGGDENEKGAKEGTRV